jgi:hypothetical protein
MRKGFSILIQGFDIYSPNTNRHRREAIYFKLIKT